MRFYRLVPLAALALGACAGATLDRPGPEAGAVAVTGADLVMHRWESRGAARGVVVGLHGYGDAGDLTFGEAARYWAGRGIAVYAVDQRGFGGNASRKRWPGVGALVADAVAVVGEVKAKHPGVPLVVVGHSMGGGVALAAAAAGMEADGLVLLGPAIAGGGELNPIWRAGAWAAATVVPEKRWTGGGLVRIRPTDNADALRRIGGHPRHIADPSSRELYGLVVLMDRAAEGAGRVEMPVLTLMGAKDEVLRPERVAAVHGRIPGGAGFVVYPEGWHWLLADRQAERVWRDVADFVLRVGPAGR